MTLPTRARFPRALPLAFACLLSVTACERDAADRATVKVPEGTVMTIQLETGLSTLCSNPGDTFEAVLITPVGAGAIVAIPEGTAVRGEVTEVETPDDSGRRPRITLALDADVYLPTDTLSLSTRPVAFVGVQPGTTPEEAGEQVARGATEDRGVSLATTTVVVQTGVDGQIDLTEGQRIDLQVSEETELPVESANVGENIRSNGNSGTNH